MQDWEALKYFLINLGLLNLVLVAVALGVGLILGRLVWARSAQGLVQLRERMSVEVDRAKEAELELEEEREKFREFREKVEAGEGGTVVINSPELEEEVSALRQRTTEADATLEQMLVANQALEVVVKELEAAKAELSEGMTTGAEHDAAELAGLRAEIEVLRKESKELRGERDEISVKVKKLQGALEKAEAVGEELAAQKGQDEEMSERVAALELQLLDARRERKQVEEASGILRKELYGMRSKLEEVEKRESLEKELDDALKDAELRLTRLQAEVAKGAVEEKADEGEGQEEGAEEVILEALEDEKSEDPEPEVEAGESEEPEEEEVVRLEVVDDGDEDDVVETEVPSGRGAGGEAEDVEVEDDLTEMKGVGAVLAKGLKEAGVTRFQQIAEWTSEEEKEISKKLGLKNRMKSGDWRGQARALHQKHHGG